MMTEQELIDRFDKECGRDRKKIITTRAVMEEVILPMGLGLICGTLLFIFVILPWLEAHW